MSNLKTPIGWLKIQEKNGKLVDIEILTRKPTTKQTPAAWELKAEAALLKYFQGKNKKISLPVNALGTDFQQRVWQALQNIPFGQVKTYGQLTKELNSSARAVGNACRANPVPIVIPCHRVIAVSGIGGYSGKTAGPVLDRKRW